MHADAFDEPATLANAAKGYDQLTEQLQCDLPDFNQVLRCCGGLYRSLP